MVAVHAGTGEFLESAGARLSQACSAAGRESVTTAALEPTSASEAPRQRQVLRAAADRLQAARAGTASQRPVKVPAAAAVAELAARRAGRGGAGLLDTTGVPDVLHSSNSQGMAAGA